MELIHGSEVIVYYDSISNSLDVESGTEIYTSITSKLQPTIATWYNALRRIALVGLLSVLVYIGIRIVLTSSSQDKAKYKNMIKDWLVAICLLFVLHYIMNITLIVTNKVSDIFVTGESDALLNTLRGEILEGHWGEVLAQVIMYVVLVIYTVTFTIQYLKRVIYMAFFTMIAPLITLTYPLDKVKDGQAQAFNMWIKEYIFTALTQVIHLVIYFVLVGSAIELVDGYPIYAIIVIAFIKKAEGIIKKMFGFDKADTVSTLGAAATGGLVMNAINKMKGWSKPSKGGSGGAEGAGGANKIRTATNNSLNGLRTGAGSGSSSSSGGSNSGSSSQAQVQRDISGAKTSTKKRYLGPALKAGFRSAAGGFMGLSGAIIGASAALAQGDLESVIPTALAGGAAGKNIGQGVVNGVINIGSGIGSGVTEFVDTWNEGAKGEEYANTIRFKRSSDYKDLKKKYKDDLTDEKLQAMIGAGITQKDDMDKILINNDGNIENTIKYYQIAKNCPNEIYDDKESLEKFWKDMCEKGDMPYDVKTEDEIRNLLGNFR